MKVVMQNISLFTKKGLTQTSIRQIALDIGLPDATVLGDLVKIYRQKGEARIKDTNSRNYSLLHEERFPFLLLNY